MYVQYDMVVGLHVPKKFQMSDKPPKKHYGGGVGAVTLISSIPYLGETAPEEKAEIFASSNFVH